MTRIIDAVLVALMEWCIVKNTIVVALGCLEKVIVRVEEGVGWKIVVVAVRGKEGGKSCKVVSGIKATSTTANATAHRDVVVTVRGKGDCIGGDGGGRATMTGLVIVYNAAVAPSKGVDIVAAVLEALEKSVVTVMGEMGENREIGGGGE
ncbi:hypothetical protein EV421DRAFT_1745766 [Armillaria borealis]|uniref:Uncharacterized protein n=1 Tax=Armillaria borealis TaxID=47425 RepID=A0AA39ICI8_9AGAR|nr:hypothetical protein EV421DRAFT_1745766 [Armillaria borealis]